MSGLVERQLRQRRPGRAELGNPGRQLLLGELRPFQGKAQPVVLVGHGPNLGRLFAQYPVLPVQAQVLARQLLGGLPDALRPLLLLVQLLVEVADRLVPPAHLPVQPGDFLAQRLDRFLALRRLFQGRASPSGFPGRLPPGAAPARRRCRQGIVQPGDLLAERPDQRGLARPGARFGKKCLQAHHLRPQGGYVACRAAEFLRLLLGLAQPSSAGLEPRFPRTGIATGGHFRPAQFFATRFGRLRPRPLLFIQGLEIARRDRRCRPGRRPEPVAALGQPRVYGEIFVQNRHALDDSASQIVLPAPLCSLDSRWTMLQKRDLHGLAERLPPNGKRSARPWRRSSSGWHGCTHARSVGLGF